MALSLPGVSPINEFESGGQSIASDTAEVMAVRFRFDGANPSSSTGLLFASIVTSLGVHRLSISATSSALSFFANSTNGNTGAQTVALPAVGTELRCLIVLDHTNATYAFYMNSATPFGSGSLGSAPNSPSNSSSERRLDIQGTDEAASDILVTECLLKNSIPTTIEITNWMSGSVDAASWAGSDHIAFKPVGSGITASLTDTSGNGNDATQVTGPTSGSDAPTLTDGVASANIVITRIIDLHGDATHRLDQTISDMANDLACSYIGADRSCSLRLEGTMGRSLTAGGGIQGRVGLIGADVVLTNYSEPTGSTWTADLSFSKGGRTINLAPVDDATDRYEMPNFRCGIPLFVSGRSNASGRVTTNIPSAHHSGQTLFRWNKAATTLSAESAPTGDMITSYAASAVQNACSRKTFLDDVPVIYFNTSTGGQTISYWASGASGDTEWQTATQNGGIINHDGGFNVLWMHGESAGAGYQASLEAVMDDFKTKYGWTRWHILAIVTDNDDQRAAAKAIAESRDDARSVGDCYFVDSTDISDAHLDDGNQATMIAGMLYQHLMRDIIPGVVPLMPSQQINFYRGSTPVVGAVVGA